MQDPTSANTSNKSSAIRAPEPTVLTGLQQKKRTEVSQPEVPTPVEKQEMSAATAVQKGKSILQKKKSQKKATRVVE